MPGFGGLLIGALLVGGGFLSVVQLSLLYARELAPQHLRYMAGLLTTGYAVGPLLSFLSAALLHRLEPALWVAGASLLVWRPRRVTSFLHQSD